MKNNILKSALVVLLSLTMVSFTSKTEKKVSVEKSSIIWTGHKVTGQHEGTINLKNGFLSFDNDQLVGGEFTMDMTSLDVTDLEGEWKNKLVGHLKSEDFFNTTNHSTAQLVFTKVSGKKGKYTVTADLTIKNIKHAVNFDLTINENTAKADLKIDRTKYDIKYKSASFFENLKDKAISDEFDLNVNLTF